jgi:integrase
MKGQIMKVWITNLWVDKAGRRKANYGSGSQWRVDWYEVMPDGSKKIRSRKFSRKTDAEAFRTKSEHEMRSGIYRSPEFAEKTFAVLASEYMATKHSIKGSTRTRSERELRSWILPQWGNRKIGTITHSQVEQWVTALAEGTAPHVFIGRSVDRVARPLAANSIKHLMLIVSASFEFAIRNDWLTKNPAKDVEKPKATQKPQIYLDFSEVEALADKAYGVDENPTDRALIRLLAYTGLRIGEALSLRVGDVNVKTRRVRIVRTLTEDHGRVVIGTPKSGNARTVSLHQFILDEILPLIEGQPDVAYVFRAARGSFLHPNNWRSRVWRRAVLDTTWEGVLTPHDLRHTAASMAIAAKADVKVVQTMLGHASAVETLDRYGHLWPDRLDEVTDAVGAARDAALAVRREVSV